MALYRSTEERCPLSWRSPFRWPWREPPARRRSEHRGILRILGLQKSHGEQAELGLNDFGLAFLDHNRTATSGIGFPVYFLHLDTCESAVLAKKFKRIDVPSTRAALLMARGGLECARPVGPRVLRVVGTFRRARHNLYLRHALAALPMSRSCSPADEQCLCSRCQCRRHR